LPLKPANGAKLVCRAKTKGFPTEDKKDPKFSKANFIGSESFGKKLEKFWG
jgi:hypothetical protein